MGSTKSETVVIGLNWVGDNILALPTFRALQHRFHSEGGITVAAPRNVASLLTSSGVFRNVIGWERNTVDRIRALRAGRFRRAIILPNSFRSAAVAFGAGIPERWGYATDFRSPLLTHPVARVRERGHQLDDYAPLLGAMSAPRVVDEIPALQIPLDASEKARAALAAAGVTFERPLFGIHAGGLYGEAKHWGDTRYCETAARLRADGFDIILLTSPGERVQAEAISTACGGIPIVGQDGDVLQLAAAIAHCAVVLTNDSGPLHLAAALAVPSVSIFGPTDPGRTVIPGTSRVIRRPMACQPCYKRQCPLTHHRCMNEIGVDEVYNAAVALFADAESPEEAKPEVFRVL